MYFMDYIGPYMHGARPYMSEVNLSKYILSECNLSEFQNYFQFIIIFYILYLFILG